jgi:hypothetical protein
MKRLFALVAASAALGSTSPAVHAHHASSAFDRQSSVTVAGTVKRWQFINPHSGIWIDVESEGGAEEWVGEFQGTLDLYRHFSWNKDTFHPGDRVTLTGFPARDGSKAMSVRIVVFSDGTEVDVRSAPD